MARFLRRFLSIQRPVARFLTCSTGSQQARTQSLARTPGPPSVVANPMAVAVALRRASPATCGASGRVLLINGCFNHLSRPIRSPGTICTPNIVLIAFDPCNSVTIVV